MDHAGLSTMISLTRGDANVSLRLACLLTCTLHRAINVSLNHATICLTDGNVMHVDGAHEASTVYIGMSDILSRNSQSSSQSQRKGDNILPFTIDDGRAHRSSHAA